MEASKKPSSLDSHLEHFHSIAKSLLLQVGTPDQAIVVLSL